MSDSKNNLPKVQLNEISFQKSTRLVNIGEILFVEFMYTDHRNKEVKKIEHHDNIQFF